MIRTVVIDFCTVITHCKFILLFGIKARFRRRILHVSNTIRIRFAEEHAKFDWCFKRRISHVSNSIRLGRSLDDVS